MDLCIHIQRLAEEANRRGLEPELLTVALTELLDVPPPGTAGAYISHAGVLALLRMQALPLRVLRCMPGTCG